MRLMRFLIISPLIFLCAFSFSTKVRISENALIDSYSTIVIAGFNFKYDDSKDLPDVTGKSFGDIIGSYFVKFGMKVLERRHLELVLQEKELQMSGIIDNDRASEIGKLMHAQFVVYGEGIAAQTTSSNVPLKDVVLKMTDVETGEIVMTATWSGEAISYTEVAHKMGKEILHKLKKRN
jgi:curli biogenesis system outer membrane secretion channel CsgG